MPALSELVARLPASESRQGTNPRLGIGSKTVPLIGEHVVARSRSREFNTSDTVLTAVARNEV
jgi:hypothetical protein